MQAVRRAIAVLGISAMASIGVVTTDAGASTPGVTSNTITLGFVGNLTGVAASTFFDSAGAIQARIAAQNASGGVNGRKLKVIIKDDGSSGTTDQLAARELIQSGVFGVVADSAFFFVSAKAYQQAGIPVTGAAFDGPEWGQQPYTNMFSYYPVVETPFNGKVYNYDYWGPFANSLGIKSAGGIAYGISPSAQAAIATTLASMSKHGVSTCYVNNSVPFGGVDFTSDVLVIKSKNCGGVAVALVDSSDVALGQALKNANAKTTLFLSGTGYDSSVASSRGSMASLEGDYADALVNFTTPNAATQTMLNNLKRYDPQYHGGVPDYGTQVAYLATDLMIKGIQAAGRNLTQSSFISAMYNKVKSYNAGGALPGTNTFSLKNFGTVDMLPKNYCTYWIKIQAGKFVVANGGVPGCGGRVSAQKPS